MKTLYLYCTFALTATSCTNLSDRRTEQPIISIVDINEANALHSLLAQDPQLKGLYKVTPDRQETKVIFSAPPRPQDDAAFRRYMTEVKSAFTKNRGRTANTIVAIFPEKEYRF